MRVLDLFSGLEGWSQAFRDRDHQVVTVDIDSRFNPTICVDVRVLVPAYFHSFGPFDIILASPPCNCFSVASVYRHWNKATKRPKDLATIDAIGLVAHTIWLILNLTPRWWILENPRGMMRRVLGKPAITTSFAAWQTDRERDELYSSWGVNDKSWKYIKPTDLWGVFPDHIKWGRGKPKDYIRASRGSRLGIQEQNDRAMRSKIPYALSLAVCSACEAELSS